MEGNTTSPDAPVSAPGEVTELLNRYARGDKQAEQQLLPVIYKELRRIAAHHLRRERPGHTLQPTDLVHEAYLRMTGLRETEWKSRTHFFAMAAQVMRHVLVDYARRREAGKRGGGQAHLALTDDLAVSGHQCLLILDLDAALTRLQRLHARQARVVELRFFAGLTEDEIAELLAVSVKTVKRDWIAARAWIYGELRG